MTKYKVFKEAGMGRGGDWDHLRTVEADSKKEAVEKAIEKVKNHPRATLGNIAFFMVFPESYWAQFELRNGQVRQAAP